MALSDYINQLNNYNAKTYNYDSEDNKSTQGDGKEKFGAASWADIGMKGLGTIANITTSGIALAQAQDQINAANEQRKLENKRYDEQIARNKKATDDTANTASVMQSASGNMQGTREAPPPPQEPQAQAQELPMERQ